MMMRMMDSNNFGPLDEESATIRRHFGLKKLAVIAVASTCGAAGLISYNRKSASAPPKANLLRSFPFSSDGSGSGRTNEKSLEWDKLIADSAPGKSATITTAPFLMAHDAAMVYLPPSITGCGTHKTQALLWNDSTKSFVMGLEHSRNSNNINDSPFTALLDCGARALDIRLRSKYSTLLCPTGPTDLSSNKLYMHHSLNYICSTTFDDQLPSIIEWSKNNPSEWVFLKIDTKGDTKADPLVEDLFKHYGIPLLNNNDSNNCGGEWLMDDTSKRGLVGYMAKCSDDDYDPLIGYCKSDSRSYPQLQEYLYKNQEKGTQNAAKAPSEQQFLETQLLWQQIGSTPFLCFQKYDVLHLDHKSKLSGHVAEMLNPTSSTPTYLKKTHDGTPGTYNMIKMNNICEHGIEIAKSIGTFITNEQQDRCYQYCGGINKYNDCGMANNPNYNDQLFG